MFKKHQIENNLNFEALLMFIIKRNNIKIVIHIYSKSVA